MKYKNLSLPKNLNEADIQRTLTRKGKIHLTKGAFGQPDLKFQGQKLLSPKEMREKYARSKTDKTSSKKAGEGLEEKS